MRIFEKSQVKSKKYNYTGFAEQRPLLWIVLSQRNDSQNIYYFCVVRTWIIRPGSSHNVERISDLHRLLNQPVSIGQ